MVERIVEGCRYRAQSKNDTVREILAVTDDPAFSSAVGARISSLTHRQGGSAASAMVECLMWLMESRR